MRKNKFSIFSNGAFGIILTSRLTVTIVKGRPMSYRLPPIADNRPKKSDVPADRLCEHCSAKCCRYFALPIDTPENFEEFDFARWYLLHENATIFVENGSWFLMIQTVCKALDDKNRCKIYENRPQICREYTTDKCEYEDLFVFEKYFETPEQIEEYAEAVLGPRPGTEFRTAKL